MWRRWRTALDIDALSYESLQLLPALAASLPRWLEGDESAARIQGIVKMVWSRNQVRLHKAAELHQTLLRAEVAPVAVTGPLAWSLLTREEGAIRSIPNLSLLIPRRHVRNAVSALARDGWEMCGNLPDSEALDWNCHLTLIKADETLHLHWRLFSTQAREAAGCETAFLKRLRTIVWNRHSFQMLSPEADLLHRLTDRPAWDPVPWQADVLMMPFAGVDWPRLRELALRFAPVFEPVDLLGRLMELRRDWELPIPDLVLASRRPPSGAIEGAAGSRLSFAQLCRGLLTGGKFPWRS